MSPKRGDPAAPPALPAEYTLKFATNDAANGWEELCRLAPANTRAAFDAIRANRRPNPSTSRHHRLKHDLAWASHDGRALEQWQYEVTGGGRIWYVIDDDKRLCWLKHAGAGHPKQTDKH